MLPGHDTIFPESILYPIYPVKDRHPLFCPISGSSKTDHVSWNYAKWSSYQWVKLQLFPTWKNFKYENTNTLLLNILKLIITYKCIGEWKIFKNYYLVHHTLKY